MDTNAAVYSGASNTCYGFCNRSNFPGMEEPSVPATAGFLESGHTMDVQGITDRASGKNAPLGRGFMSTRR